MKVSKLASAVFAVVGTVLLVGSIVTGFVALNSPTRAVKPTQEANVCAQSVLRALDDGDLSKVGEYLYGKPSLGLDREPATTEGRQLWDAYLDPRRIERFWGRYGEGTNIYQTAQVSYMDIAQTLSGLDRRAGELLKETLDAQENPAALLGEDGQIPEKLKEELRRQALGEALAELKTVTGQITFQLVEQDGQWWVLPDQAMLDILSGGLG